MEAQLTPHILTKNFKVKIWPEHGKMTDPPQFSEAEGSYRFAIDLHMYE